MSTADSRSKKLSPISINTIDSDPFAQNLALLCTLPLSRKKHARSRTSPIQGDIRVILVCYCSDTRFIHRRVSGEGFCVVSQWRLLAMPHLAASLGCACLREIFRIRHCPFSEESRLPASFASSASAFLSHQASLYCI
jgi:hypothetical protein